MIETQLLKKINDRSLTVGIIGLGYVGLPLFLWHAELDIAVIGFDIDQSKIDSLNRHESYIENFLCSKIWGQSNL